MDLRAAGEMARELMLKHGLGHWGFEWMQSRRTFGRCRYATGSTAPLAFRRGTIELSVPLVSLNTEQEVRNTILHEIAHALCGPGMGHGRHWKLMAASVGAVPVRCYDTTGERSVVVPPSRLELRCPKCDWIGRCERRPKRTKLCPRCYRWRQYRTLPGASQHVPLECGPSRPAAKVVPPPAVVEAVAAFKAAVIGTPEAPKPTRPVAALAGNLTALAAAFGGKALQDIAKGGSGYGWAKAAAKKAFLARPDLRG